MGPLSVPGPAGAPAAARGSADPGSSAACSAPQGRPAGYPIFGAKIRRTVEGDVASAQASAGNLASARLSAQGALASDYLQLRMSDELKRLFDAAASYYAESLRIARNQYQAGTTDQSAVSQAEAQLESTQAQAIAVGVTRAQLEHAIAVLIGKPPAEFSISATDQVIAVPVIPPGVPSTLLERRPDIAAAERLMASANAQIGVAEAAFYPDLTLSASFAYEGFNLGSLIQAANKVWSVGPQLAQTLFDGGLRSAVLEQNR